MCNSIKTKSFCENCCNCSLQYLKYAKLLNFHNFQPLIKIYWVITKPKNVRIINLYLYSACREIRLQNHQNIEKMNAIPILFRNFFLYKFMEKCLFSKISYKFIKKWKNNRRKNRKESARITSFYYQHFYMTSQLSTDQRSFWPIFGSQELTN